MKEEYATHGSLEGSHIPYEESVFHEDGHALVSDAMPEAKEDGSAIKAETKDEHLKAETLKIDSIIGKESEGVKS